MRRRFGGRLPGNVVFWILPVGWFLPLFLSRASLPAKIWIVLCFLGWLSLLGRRWQSHAVRREQDRRECLAAALRYEQSQSYHRDTAVI